MHQPFYNVDNYQGFEGLQLRLDNQSIPGISPERFDYTSFQGNFPGNRLTSSSTKQIEDTGFMYDNNITRSFMQGIPHPVQDGGSRLFHPYRIAENRTQQEQSRKGKLSGGFRFPSSPIRAPANARERTRTHSVNDVFNKLRRHIPTEPANRKLSKIETLRLATSYISHLSELITNADELAERPPFNDDYLDELVYVSCASRRGDSNQICTFCACYLTSIKNK